MNKKVILIAMDALVVSNLEIIRDMPGFKRIMQYGAHCPKVMSMYPSITKGWFKL